MNSEDKIYNKIKNASHKGEKDFPEMDKIWSRVEGKLNNTIVVQNKKHWQKLAITVTVLLSFSIIYQFVSMEENIKNKIIPSNSNPVIVSTDSINKIINEANEDVIKNETSIKNKPNENNNRSKDNLYQKNSLDNNVTIIERDSIIYKTLPNGKIIAKTHDYPNKIVNSIEDNSYLRSNFTDNSASNSSNSNSGFIAPSKKDNAPAKKIKSKYKAPKSKPVAPPSQQNKDLVVIDDVAMDKNYNAEKELNKISEEEIEEITYLPNPLYIINGIEYSEESLFGKNPTSPYAPLDKQKIISTSILKAVEATKIYGKKGEKGIVIITTKDGKPAEK